MNLDDQLKKNIYIHNITQNFSMLHELNISLNSKKSDKIVNIYIWLTSTKTKRRRKTEKEMCFKQTAQLTNYQV